ncbi:MAG: YeeE/YedE thiosulfate transporter family protein [Bacteroidota bacterium]
MENPFVVLIRTFTDFMQELLMKPWPWYLAGPLIGLTMFLMLYFGKAFGVSSTMRTICAAGGAGKLASFFDFKWRYHVWNLVFVIGALIGGFLASEYMQNPNPIELNAETIAELNKYGFTKAGEGYLPKEVFSWDQLATIKGLILLIGGGFLVGFGTRYAGGCTSGHAISGLSNLQLPSLIAVIGFFIGGMITVYLIFPTLLKL